MPWSPFPLPRIIALELLFSQFKDSPPGRLKHYVIPLFFVAFPQ